MPAFLRQILAPDTKAPWWYTAGVTLLLAVAAWVYVRAANWHGETVSARIDKELQGECRVLFQNDKKAMENAGRPTHAYDLNDQRVYMNYAMGLRESDYKMFVTRMRMPMYMWALSLRADDTVRTGMNYEQLEKTYTDFFPEARAFNIGLSVVLLVALFFALRPWLGNWMGVVFVLAAAFQLFIYKSPYVQPEVLQTAIITVSIAWIVTALHDPKWWKALIAGLLLCLWHMTKANALVALGLMGAIMGCKVFFAGTWPKRRALIISGLAAVALAIGVASSIYLWGKHAQDGWTAQLKEVFEANGKVILGFVAAVLGAAAMFRGEQPKRLAILIAGPIVLAGYILPMSPFLYTSYKTFGSPFYNVQSKFYMWAEDRDHKHELQDMGLDRNLDRVDLDRDGKIDHPEELPGPMKYWREHSWEEITERLRKGIDSMFEAAFTEYAPLHWLQMVWAGILIWAAARRWPEAVEAVRRWKWEMVFVAALLTAFVYLFGWFVKLNVGPRLLNSVSLIPLFFCMAGTHWLLRKDAVTVRGAVLSTEKLLALAFLGMWLWLTVSFLPMDLENGYFAG